MHAARLMYSSNNMLKNADAPNVCVCITQAKLNI